MFCHVICPAASGLDFNPKLLRKEENDFKPFSSQTMDQVKNEVNFKKLIA